MATLMHDAGLDPHVQPPPRLRPAHRWLAGALLGAAGFALNLVPFSLGFGLDFLIGGYLAVLAVLVLGLGPGVLAGALSGAATYFLWEHPYAAIVFTLEILAIGLLTGRYRIPALIVGAGFWALVAPPLLILGYHIIMGMTMDAVLLVILKQGVNGILQIVAAELTLIALARQLPRLSGHPGHVTLRDIVLNLLIFFAAASATIAMIVNAQAGFARFESGKIEALQGGAQGSEYLLQHTIRTLLDHHHDMLYATGISADSRMPETPMFRAIDDAIVLIRARTEDGKIAWEWQRDPETSNPLLVANGITMTLPHEHDLHLEVGMDRSRIVRLIHDFVQGRGLKAGILSSEDSADSFIQGQVRSDYTLRIVDPGSGVFNILPYVEGSSIMARWSASLYGLNAPSETFTDLRVIWIAQARTGIDQLRADQRRDLVIAALILCLAPLAAYVASSLVTADFKALRCRMKAYARSGDITSLSDLAFLRTREARALLQDFAVDARTIEENQATIRDLAERLDALIQHAPVVLYTMEIADGVRLIPRYVSASIERILGYGPDEALAPHWWHENVHPEDRKALFLSNLLKTSRDSISRTYRFRARDGQWRSILDQTQIRRDAKGNPTELIGVWIDRTEARNAELAMIQQSKLADLGAMATGMAHELNQPLNVIALTGANLNRRIQRGDLDPAWIKEKVDRIEGQVRRAADIIGHMRIFGRSDSHESFPFTLKEVLTPLEILVANALHLKAIAFTIEDQTGEAAVLGHPSRLEQVLVNMILNARDQIKTTQMSRPDTEQRWIRLHATRNPDHGTLVIRIEDNGGGIDVSIMDRLFEPFVTTKPSGKGTGLGLSICQTIISDMRGSIVAENTANGACFTITLPEATPAPETRDTGKRHEPHQPHEPHEFHA